MGIARMLGLAIIAGIAIPYVAQHPAGFQVESEPLSPEQIAVRQLSDMELRENYLKHLREASYKSRVQVLESSQRARFAPLLNLQNELERRGRLTWDRLRATNVAPIAAVLSDAGLLELLYAMPEGWEKKDAKFYDPVISEVLKRGGEWNKIAADWRWTGLEALSDAQLAELWDVARHADSWRTSQRDFVLTEITRRGGDDWLKFLTSLSQEPVVTIFGEVHSGANLEILTALRRLQHQPDPVAVRVDSPLEQEINFPNLPALKVTLINQDATNTPVMFMSGGDYRSGRQARWRVVAIDAHANEIEESEAMGFMGGGIFNFGVLKKDDEWTTTLNLSSYLPALPPGKYKLQILYHDSVTIADIRDIKGLIVSTSPEITLTVHPLTVYLPPGEPDEIRRRTLAIDGPLKVVAGTYDEWAYDFVPLNTNRGWVLHQGFDAVPVLVNMLDDKTLTSRQRAEILSLLFSITGQNDPRELSGESQANILGNHQDRTGPWAIAAQGRWIGFGLGGGGESNGETLDVAAQKEFAKRWSAWKGFIQQK